MQPIERAISLIQPLTTTEEDRLIPKAQSGNAAARRRVSEAYLHLVWQKASELCEPGQLGDAIAEGTLGVFEALRAFDPDRDRPFASYVPAFVEGRIRAWLRAEQGTRRVMDAGTRSYTTDEHVSMDEPLPRHGTDAEPVTLHDVLPDGSPSPEAVLVKSKRGTRLDATLNVLDTLTPNERAVLQARNCANPPTLAAIARERGCSREAVRQVEARAIAKLRAALAA